MSRCCVVCGGELPPENRKFCSQACKDEYMITPRERKCRRCGKTFTAKYYVNLCNDCVSAREKDKRRRENEEKKKRNKRFDIQAASFEDYIKAWKREREHQGGNLHYGAWAARLYTERGNEE